MLPPNLVSKRSYAKLKVALCCGKECYYPLAEIGGVAESDQVFPEPPLQTEQPWFPQPLPIRLVFDTTEYDTDRKKRCLPGPNQSNIH